MVLWLVDWLVDSCGPFARVIEVIRSKPLSQLLVSHLKAYCSFQIPKTCLPVFQHFQPISTSFAALSHPKRLAWKLLVSGSVEEVPELSAEVLEIEPGSMDANAPYP